MKRILSILLAVVVAVNSTVFALATNSVSGEMRYYYCGTNQYANAAKITVSDYSADASTRIETSTHILVNPGFIGASSELYDSSKNMLASSPRVTNSSKSYYCNSLNATADNSSNRRCNISKDCYNLIVTPDYSTNEPGLPTIPSSL